jgi:hypothetical protein
MKQAVQLARFDKKIRSKVALELQASWPVPLRARAKLQIGFFYYARWGPPPAQVDELYPPSWWAVISSDDGALLTLERRKPGDYGLAGPPDKPFAEHAFPSSWTPVLVRQMSDEVLSLLDTLSITWLSATTTDSPGVKVKKVRFNKLFPELAAPPMLVCYRAVSPEFYEWVGLR